MKSAEAEGWTCESEGEKMDKLSLMLTDSLPASSVIEPNHFLARLHPVCGHLPLDRQARALQWFGARSAVHYGI